MKTKPMSIIHGYGCYYGFSGVGASASVFFESAGASNHISLAILMIGIKICMKSTNEVVKK